jgi:hypothetical protein
LLPPDKSLQQSFQRLCLRVPRAVLSLLRADKTIRRPDSLFRVVFPSFTSDTPAFPYPVQMTIRDIWVFIIDLCFYSLQQTLRNKIILRAGRKVLQLTCRKSNPQSVPTWEWRKGPHGMRQASFPSIGVRLRWSQQDANP